jgi:uncharacterized membrane protein
MESHTSIQGIQEHRGGGGNFGVFWGNMVGFVFLFFVMGVFLWVF